MASFTAHKELWVEINLGRNDALLGDIGGWKGRVVRQFTVNNTTYYDLEINAETINDLRAERRLELERKNLCFTRVRVPSSSTHETNDHENAAQQSKSLQRVQSEWYGEVGKGYRDLTKERSDALQSSLSDPGRRQFVQAMALLGVGALVIFGMAAQCGDDQNGYYGGGGSWGRVGGGGYSG